VFPLVYEMSSDDTFVHYYPIYFGDEIEGRGSLPRKGVEENHSQLYNKLGILLIIVACLLTLGALLFLLYLIVTIARRMEGSERPSSVGVKHYRFDDEQNLPRLKQKEGRGADKA